MPEAQTHLLNQSPHVEAIQRPQSLLEYELQPGFNVAIGADAVPIARGDQISSRSGGGEDGDQFLPPSRDFDLVAEVEVPSSVETAEQGATTVIGIFRNNNSVQNNYPATFIGPVTLSPPHGERNLEGRLNLDKEGLNTTSGKVGREQLQAYGHSIDQNWVAGVSETALMFSAAEGTFQSTIGNPTDAQAPLKIRLADASPEAIDEAARDNSEVEWSIGSAAVIAAEAEPNEAQKLPLAGAEFPLMTRRLTEKIAEAADNEESIELAVPDLKEVMDYTKFVALEFDRSPGDSAEVQDNLANAGLIMTTMAEYGSSLIGSLEGVGETTLNSDYENGGESSDFRGAYDGILSSHDTLMKSQARGINKAFLRSERITKDLYGADNWAGLAKEMLSQIGRLTPDVTKASLLKSRGPMAQVVVAVDALTRRTVGQKPFRDQREIEALPRMNQKLSSEQVVLLNQALGATEQIASSMEKQKA